MQRTVAGLSATSLARFVARSSRAAGLYGVANVKVTSSMELRALNRRFRGKDKPTDVLSFSAGPSRRRTWAGDIAISAEIAKWTARGLGHSPAEEVKILALHGVLHLAGYDHESDNGRMARKEAKLRQLLGLPGGLIERTGYVGKKELSPANLPQGVRGKATGKGSRATPTRPARLR